VSVEQDAVIAVLPRPTDEPESAAPLTAVRIPRLAVLSWFVFGYRPRCTFESSIVANAATPMLATVSVCLPASRHDAAGHDGDAPPVDAAAAVPVRAVVVDDGDGVVVTPGGCCSSVAHGAHVDLSGTDVVAEVCRRGDDNDPSAAGRQEAPAGDVRASQNGAGDTDTAAIATAVPQAAAAAAPEVGATSSAAGSGAADDGAVAPSSAGRSCFVTKVPASKTSLADDLRVNDDTATAFLTFLRSLRVGVVAVAAHAMELFAVWCQLLVGVDDTALAVLSTVVDEVKRQRKAGVVVCHDEVEQAVRVAEDASAKRLLVGDKDAFKELAHGASCSVALTVAVRATRRLVVVVVCGSVWDGSTRGAFVRASANASVALRPCRCRDRRVGGTFKFVDSDRCSAMVAAPAPRYERERHAAEMHELFCSRRPSQRRDDRQGHTVRCRA
jgi:hypothetical protein